MPVKHDLLQDLGLTKEAISKFRSENPHLNQLFVQYGEKDAEVVEAEANDAIGVADDVLRKLKGCHIADDRLDRTGTCNQRGWHAFG